MANKCDYAWAAGFFEGEGGIYRVTRAVRLAVTQSELEPLERFVGVFGVGKIIAVPPNHVSKKQRYVLYVQRRAEVERMYRLMRPWLSASKRAVIETALA